VNRGPILSRGGRGEGGEGGESHGNGIGHEFSRIGEYPANTVRPFWNSSARGAGRKGGDVGRGRRGGGHVECGKGHR